MANQEDEILTTRQVAELLGVSVKTAQTWVTSGVIEAWKTPGGHRRIRRSAVERLLKNEMSGLSSAGAPPTGVAMSAVAAGTAPNRAAAASSTAYRAGHGATAILIEDDPTLLMLYEIALNGIPGLTTITASDCFTGLLRIGEHAPDFVITDLRMPGFDGFAMLQTLEKDGRLERMEVLVVTGCTQQEIDAHGGLPRSVEMLEKPVDPVSLARRVQEKLTQRAPAALSG
jgi:excisionase family DNA binding protein